MAIAMAGLLTAVAVKLVDSSQNYIRLAEAFRDEFRARWAVQAPIAVVMASLEGDDDSITSFHEEWANLKEVLTINSVRVRFRVQDEDGKINLNALNSQDVNIRQGTADLLKKIFVAQDLDAELVDSLWDWVDGDSESKVPGGEGGYYQSLPAPYPVKNASLDTLAELGLVQGFNQRVLRALGFPDFAGSPDLDLGKTLTVFSDQRINLNAADPLILRNIAGGLREDFVNDLLQRREDNPLERVADIKDLAGMDDTIFNKLAPLVTVDSRYFSVFSEVVVGRIRKRLTAVLEKDEGRVRVVYWRLS